LLSKTADELIVEVTKMYTLSITTPIGTDYLKFKDERNAGAVMRSLRLIVEGKEPNRQFDDDFNKRIYVPTGVLANSVVVLEKDG
jgi:hypothetical protein